MDWQSVNKVFDGLRAATEPQELLEVLLDGLLAMLGAPRGYALLLGEEDDAPPSIVVSRGIDDMSAFLGSGDQVHPAHQDILGGEEPMVGEDTTGRVRVVSGPLRARGETMGLVFVDYLTDENASRPATSDLAALFSAVSGVAAELLAALRTRDVLLEARGRLEAYTHLVLQDDSLVFGESEAGCELQELLAAAAARSVTVLVTGETGTGKAMVARALHRMSPRCGEPFIAVNCAALPRDIIEVELFGAEKGAFTGATERRVGRFELASSGTLFLDEIGALEPEIQIKLLRVLQERCVTRVGGSTSLPLDFRLICATNTELDAAVEAGTFRQDLYYRINVFRIHLEPLRYRREDIEPLASHFLARFAKRFAKKVHAFSDEARALILGHSWPGNVRELQNAIERAVVVETSDCIRPESLPIQAEDRQSPVESDPLEHLLENLPEGFASAREIFERAFLERAYARNKGNIAAMSRQTGIPRNTLYRRLSRLGLQRGH